MARDAWVFFKLYHALRDFGIINEIFYESLSNNSLNVWWIRFPNLLNIVHFQLLILV
jgi:hypothetical protein